MDLHYIAVPELTKCTTAEQRITERSLPRAVELMKHVPYHTINECTALEVDGNGTHHVLRHLGAGRPERSQTEVDDAHLPPTA